MPIINYQVDHNETVGGVECTRFCRKTDHPTTDRPTARPPDRSTKRLIQVYLLKKNFRGIKIKFGV